jgi:hypothetical protein
LKNYSDFKTEDFLDDEQFRKWMISGGNENSSFWESFMEQYPDKITELRLAKGIFNALHQLHIVSDSGVKAKIWNNVEQTVQETDIQDQADHSTRPLHRWFWAAAAVLLVAGGLAWNLRSTFMGQPVEYAKQVSVATTSLHETVNDTKSVQMISLKDGSTVRLTPGSKLSYSDFSEKQRVVYLNGEGFFDVAKDPAKPFLVYTGQIVVQVVGTSFNVISSTGKTKSNVSVTSGKVKVIAAAKMDGASDVKDDQAIYLTPNQQVVFDASTSEFEKGLVAEPVQVARTGDEQEFYFTNTSVNDILRDLEVAYGVKMRFNNKSLESCKVTAPLGDLPLFRKLDIICQTIGATYEVFGTEIVISGGSCDL